jgi:glucose PTS system EIIB component
MGMLKIQDFKRLFALALGEKTSEAEEGNTIDQASIVGLIAAFGGKDNIFSFDACLTRLRVEVKALGLVNSGKLQQLGAIGVVIVGHEVQAIFGKRSDNLRRDLEAWFELGDLDH